MSFEHIGLPDNLNSQFDEVNNFRLLGFNFGKKKNKPEQEDEETDQPKTLKKVVLNLDDLGLGMKSMKTAPKVKGRLPAGFKKKVEDLRNEDKTTWEKITEEVGSLITGKKTQENPEDIPSGDLLRTKMLSDVRVNSQKSGSQIIFYVAILAVVIIATVALMKKKK